MAAECTSDYTKFDAECFLRNSLQSGKDPVQDQFNTHRMQWFHEAFASDKIKGRRLLDIGTGPTFQTVISASPHVDSIFLSDFTPQCRDSLKTWLDGNLQTSFKEIFKRVVDLEGRGQCPSKREMSLRQKVSGICHIDVLQENPLAPSYFPKFDIITTSLCFVSAAQNQETYEKIARRVADMLQIGGHLLLFSVDGVKCYEVGTVLFSALDIDTDTVRKIWRNSGFKITEWKQDSIPEDVRSNVSYYLMVAKKVKSL